MLVAQGAPHILQSARVTVLLFTVISVVFWKVLLKIIVMVVMTVTIVMLAYGAIALAHVL
jgi:hypothetical protein